jgi:hypothetical protein
VKPPARLAPKLSRRASRTGFGGRSIMNSMTRTTVKVSALTRKQAAVPKPARIPAAASGPITFDVLSVTEFSATALARSWRGTSSDTSVWRAGVLKAMRMPRPVASSMITQIGASPE